MCDVPQNLERIYQSSVVPVSSQRVEYATKGFWILQTPSWACEASFIEGQGSSQDDWPWAIISVAEGRQDRRSFPQTRRWLAAMGIWLVRIINAGRLLRTELIALS